MKMVKDEIYKYLVEYSNSITDFSFTSLKAFTTGSIEKNFNMKTSVANYHLNQLYKEGKLVKINTKPVYYLPVIFIKKITGFIPSKLTYKNIDELKVDKPSNILDQIIGSSGSLQECIRQCKVAINYPGKGLPILLSGPTGSGKTFLAKCLFNYAVQEKILSQDAPFIIFNCAEYANNPELLESKLFGYVKGAFTGADRDVSGIIENANNGILLIDEVHRLSPENQEKLFMLMDDGIFSRIGENNKIRKANVRLIFATTEDLNTVLLKTFLRRIPIVIKLPSLEERGLTEKQAFIYYFFKQQSKIISKEIRVESSVISYLTSTSLEGNVGGLENIIKYTCANAFFEYKNSSYILVKLQHIPLLSNSRQSINIGEEKVEIIKIDENRVENDPILARKIEIYVKFEQELVQLLKSALSGKIRMSIYRQKALECINKFLKRHPMCNEINNRWYFITESVKNSLGLIEDQYNIKFEPICIQTIIEYIIKISGDLQRDYFKERLEQKMLQKIFSFNYELCDSFIKIMQQLNLRYPINYLDIDKLVITTIFDYYSNQKVMTKIKAVIVSHGYSTASNLASTANKFIGENVYRAFDVQLETSFEEIIRNLQYYFKHIDTRDGVIILVDFVDIEKLQKEISKTVEGDIAIVDNISLKLAINIGQKILNEEPLSKIIRESIENNTTNFQIFRTQRKREKALIVTCQTGVGTSFKIKKLIEQCFDENVPIDVIVCEYSRLVKDKGDMSIFSRYEIIGILGTADPKVCQVPFIGIEDLMDEQGADKLQNLFHEHLSINEIQKLNDKLIKALSKENIVNLLTILNPDKILFYIENMIHGWEKDFGITFPNNLVMSLYIHLSGMIERVITHNEITFHDNQQKYEEEHKYFFKAIHKAFEEIERNYHIKVPNSEIAYIYDIFKLKMPNFQF
ncbi:sigma 54-interacting transcriptional regulator [Thermoanaerobacterium thermosaccharolyticum]|uniref:sigma 54-interacting transcriptional regulator n=1 Tax=Thermoanaerobacterium thermosaccharolyticum TaxID=1517 RepID=UPI00123959CA|nr:sigma 54-interacting transcriptional regulator [Thermoanaerobacterium thermosaccharolyticum]KAA5806030.1 PRD domain-containing protein [Thermoanaerobacterium thermosaccharolyticum]